MMTYTKRRVLTLFAIVVIVAALVGTFRWWLPWLLIFLGVVEENSDLIGGLADVLNIVQSVVWIVILPILAFLGLRIRSRFGTNVGSETQQPGGEDVNRSSQKGLVDPGVVSSPWRPDYFVGRDEDIEALVGMIGEELASNELAAPFTIAITGLPGVGKTSIAAELCNRKEIAEFFPDGVSWASLGPSPNLISILARLSRSLGGPPLEQVSSVEEASLHLNNFVGDKKLLIVVDDVFEAEHALPLKIPREGALVATSRSSAVAHELSRHGEVYELQTLSEGEAVELLGKIAPMVAQEDSDLCRELARELGGLPLALQVAGRLLEEEASYGWDISELLAELREGKKLLQSKAPVSTGGLSGTVSPTVEALLRTSFDRLDASSQKCFRRLAIMSPKPSTFDYEAVEAVCDLEDGRGQIRSLVQRGLLEKASNGRFTVHPVLRMFSKLLLDEDSAELHDAGKRHSRHFLSVFARTKNLYLTDLFHASKMLETNWENVQAGWPWAASHYETDDEAARLCIDYLVAGEPWLNFRFTAEEHVDWACTAVRAARRLDDASAEAHSLSRLAVAYQSAARLGEAKDCHEVAIKKFRELGDTRGEGRATADLGTYFKVTGDPVSAERCYKKQIAITQKFGDRRNEAAARGNLGLIYRDWGKYDEAIREISTAAKIFKRINDRREEAGAWANLGTVYLDMGDPDKSEQEHLKYLNLARSLQDRRGQCRAFGNLSNVYFARTEYMRAALCSRRSLRLARELNDARAEAHALGNIASAKAQLGYASGARTLYEQELQITESLNDLHGSTVAHNNLAKFLKDTGESSIALRHNALALRGFRKLGCPAGEADAMWNAALASDQLGHRKKAYERLQRALHIYKKIDSPKAQDVEDQLNRWGKMNPVKDLG